MALRTLNHKITMETYFELFLKLTVWAKKSALKTVRLFLRLVSVTRAMLQHSKASECSECKELLTSFNPINSVESFSFTAHGDLELSLLVSCLSYISTC